MLDKQIESLGQLTQQKIAQASDALRADMVEKDREIHAKHIELQEFMQKELDDIGGLAYRLREEIKEQEALHRVEIDAIKQQVAEQSGLDALVEKEVGELDAAFSYQLGIEKDQIEQRIVNQALIHKIEIDTIKERLEHQKDFERHFSERIEQIKDGEKGNQGIQGEPGTDGQDRPLIEPVCLDERKYPKNTLGTHAGGLWISRKKAMGSPESDPHAWHCILDAMDTFDIDLQDDGTYILSVRMATGRVIKNTLDIPYPEHCGIWEEREYRKGQIVTKGSSFWQAMENTTGAPPGNGWRQILSAPRGKAGPPGASVTGPPGKPGRNGRDAKLDEAFIADLEEIVAQYRGQD